MAVERFQQVLGAMLVEVYHNIAQLEEQVLRQAGDLALSISEMHLIECVGKQGPEGLTIRALALELGVKSPSVTVAVKKLEGKGYVQKIACERDGRAVRVQLTQSGRRMDAYHRYYHRMMVKAMSEGMTEEERAALLRAVSKLNAYFLQSLQDMQASGKRPI